jgi:membrane protein DedA with SNARE-associated domain
MNDVLSWLLDAVQSVDPIARTLVAAGAMLLETSLFVGLIVPGDTVAIVAGSAVGSPLEGVSLAVAIILASLAGESIGYGLGRWAGPAIRRSWIGRRIGEETWVRAERYIRRRGGPAIFLSRFLPVLHSVVPVAVGMSGFTYRRFLAWTAPACALWASLYVTVSALAAGTYRSLSQELHIAGYLFVGVIALFLVGVVVAKGALHRRERRHLEADDEAGAESPHGVSAQAGMGD